MLLQKKLQKIMKSKKQNKNKNELTVAAHTKELIFRVLKCVLIWIIAFAFFYVNALSILSFLRQLADEVGYVLIAIAPQDVLLQELRLAATLALICTFPLLLFEVSAFVFPIFDSKKIKVKIVFTEIVAMALFVFGVVLAYKLLLPTIIRFLAEISVDAMVASQISLKEYVSLYLTLVFCIGLIFEMPLLVIVLTRAGIVTPERMKGAFRWVIVLCFIVAAIITPPDIISQIMVALPMIVLYGVSILLSALFVPRRKNEKS